MSRFIHDYAECRYAECRYAECRGALRRGRIKLNRCRSYKKFIWSNFTHSFCKLDHFYVIDEIVHNNEMAKLTKRVSKVTQKVYMLGSRCRSYNKTFRSNFTHSFCKLDHFCAMDKIVHNNKMVKLTKVSG